MIASLLSDREAQSVGDVFEEAGKAIRFLGERSVQDLSDDEVVFYAVEAVERAMMNVSEACIRIEKSAYAGRFEALFPDFAFDDLRRTGNFIRHAYDDRRVDEAWQTVKTVMPALRDRAEALLAAHRRLRGG